MYQVLLGLPLLLGGLSAPALVSDQTQQVQVENQVQPKLVSYNDTDNTITLTASETRYSYENFYNLYTNTEGLSWQSVSFTLNINGTDYLYSYDEGASDADVITFTNPNSDSEGTIQYSVGLVLNWVELGFMPVEDYPQYNYYFYNYYNDALLDLPLIIHSDNYNATKSAIEQDIVANSTMPSISDLFTPITQAITSFVGALGQAFSSVTALFWTTGENAGPTFLGLLVLIGVGVGLIYGAYRIIKGLMHRI